VAQSFFGFLAVVQVFKAVVPKLGINYPPEPGIIRDSPGGNEDVTQYNTQQNSIQYTITQYNTQ